ncbi:MAG: cell envelope integrity protein TolA, partial [Lachnospiraceae bacterium]|nr:cell envelope integrity protein TolA [Lachnospiraceae bacterium]
LQEARAQKEKRIEEENRQKREIEEKARQEKERKDKEKERREQEEPKKEEPVKEAQKKEDSKKEGQKKEELVKEAQKKEDPKKEDRKKNEPVKEKQENPNRKTGKEAGDMQLIDEQKNERIAGIVGEELTAPADLGEREQADKSLMEKYDLGAITQGQWFGGSVMFGLLGNVLSDESKEKLYKDLSFFDVAKKDVEGAKAAYGRGYHGLLDMMDPAAEDPVDEAEYTETSNDAKIFINEKPSMFRHYTNIAFEKPLKNFDDAMKRLIKAIDKRLERGDFDSSGHEKYLRMMRGFAKDIVDGTFSQKMKSDPQYEYAYNMTAKIRNTAPSTEVVEGKFTPVLQENIDDIRNLRLLTPTGIIDSMAGAKRANEMLDIHLTTGDFTRDDLIAEYTQQQKRLEKALGISQEDFERISNTGAFDNKWEEFVADSDRGYGWALFDVGAKLQTLKAGYPVSDLSTFCAYARAIYDADKAVNEATEDLEAAKKEAKTSGKKTAEELKNMEGRLNRQKEILATMKRVWNEAVNVKNLTESERKRLISNMANALNEARFNIADNQYYKKGNALAVERAQAPLTGYEKAQLTGSSTVLYQLLKQVDPRTLSSSKQFVNLKKELKELARLQRETEDWDSVLGKAQYTEQLEKTMVAAAAYLKFKTKQYNEPGTSHKRSVREARRVRMVEAIFNGLRNQKFPATDIPVCEKNIKPLVTVTAESRQLGRIEKDKLPVSYDSYIRLHTGRAAANSTKEEMAAVVPKVLAAYMLKKEAEPQPFSLDRLNRHAKVVSERLGLSAMNEEELSDVLADPGRLGRNIKVITAENFGIDMPGAYERFVRGMKKLYKNLPAPEKDDAYARIFENVKKLAHLPAKSDGMDADKLAETIAATNCELVYSVKKLIEGHEKNIGDIEKHGLDVLGVIRGSSKPNTHVIGDFEKKLNKIRGTETYESDYYEKYGALVHIDLDDYNSLRYTTENPRELDRKLLEDAKKAYAMSSVQKAKQSFSANEEPAAPKTGSNPEIKDKKKHKVISKDFDNADVTGRKIKL